MVYKMVLVLLSMKTRIDMWVNLKMAARKEKEFIILVKVQYLRELGIMILK
jgi:hypothetical protein